MSDVNDHIEYVLLRANLTDRNVDELVASAIDQNCHSICVPPFWTKRATREINNRNLILSTAVGIPFGYQMAETKLIEIEKAIDNGANEVDVMMNTSAFVSGMPWTKIEFAKCSKLAHDRNVIVKVIMDASFFDPNSGIEISKIAGDTGIDFLHVAFPSQPLEWSTDYISKIKPLLPSSMGLQISSPAFNHEDVNELVRLGVERVGLTFSVLD